MLTVAAQPEAENDGSEAEHDETKEAPVEKQEIISWRRKPDDDGDSAPPSESRKRYSPDRRRRQNGLYICLNTEFQLQLIMNFVCARKFAQKIKNFFFNFINQMIDVTPENETTIEVTTIAIIAIIAISGTIIAIIATIIKGLYWKFT